MSSVISIQKEVVWASAKKALFLFSVGLAVILFSVPASAQLNYGRVYGSVTDQSGGAMVGVTVSVIDVDRGITRPLTTDDAGTYSASSLLPGNYTVRAEAKGFKAGEHTGLTVGVGQDVRVDLSLQAGEQTQTVTVTGEAPMVNTTSATLGGTLETATIIDLPLNGRAFQKLLDFNPGMQALPGGGTPTYNSNGIRGGNNTWMLDGVDEINMAGGAGPTVGGNGGGVDGITILSLDAIQEINTIQSPKAEYGWMAGSTVNVGLKSGTNSVHGTAFAFGRDGAMDAKNAFLAPGLGKSTDNLTQYGVTIGGPIKKDRLFFFGTYEGNRYTLGTPRTINEPTDVAGLGPTSSIPDAISGLIANGIALSPMSVKMAGCNATGVSSLTKATTSPAAVAAFCGPGASGAPLSLFGNNTNAQNLGVLFNNLGGSDNGLGKLDYHLNDKNSFNGEYFFGNGNVDNAIATVSPFWLADNHIRTQTGRAIWVWTPTSSTVNEMRFGVLKYRQVGWPDDCGGTHGQPDYAAAYGFNLGVTVAPPQCGFPIVSLTGFDKLGVQATNGGPQDNSFSVWSGQDSVSYTRGKHLFKFGGEIHDTRFFGSKSVTNDLGTFNFTTVTPTGFAAASPLQDFLSGTATNGTILVGSNRVKVLYYNRYALFAQDDFRLTPRITLNLGLRWEKIGSPSTPDNELANFDITSPSGLVQEKNGSGVYRSPNDEFSPRLGIAWDMTGKGTTVLRVGGSYMYNFFVFQRILPNLQAIPTGFALTLPNGSIVSPQPGGNLNGTLALSNTAINWLGTGPVVSFTPNPVNTFGLGCGNGLGSVNPALPANAATNPANPTPCNISPLLQNMKPDTVTSWNLSLQHAFASNLSLNVAYVGTHGASLYGSADINTPALGVKNGSGVSSQLETARRPFTANCPASPCFPYLGSVTLTLPNTVSNYNALQASLQKRLSHGLSFNAGYTYAHALDEASGIANSGGGPENGNNPQAEYANAGFDARHHFTFTATYNIPGHKAPLQILEGWQVNVALNMLSGLPFNAADTSDDLSGTGINQDRWNILGSPKNFKAGTAAPIPCFGVPNSTFATSGACTIVAAGTSTKGTPSFVSNMPAQCLTAATTASVSNGGLWNVSSNSLVPTSDRAYNGLAALGSFGCYFQNGSAIVPAAQGTYGAMGRNVLTDHPFRETDLSITKSWKFNERLSAQFRGEFFNVFNAVEFAVPAGNLASPATFGAAATTPNLASLIFGNGGPRTVQLGLKLLF
jgi:hypothetical protein